MTDRLTYVGHATVLLELGGTRVLTDPLLRDRFLVARRHSRAPDPGLVEGLDAVLISHLHGDHLDPGSLDRIPRGTPVVVPRRGGRLLRRRGFTDVTELGEGEELRVGAVEVRATRAVHDGRRWKFGRHVDALGYVVRSPETSVYFAGDTDLFDAMTELGEIDVALLPIGGWGPKVGSGHLNPERAAEAAARIRPRVVVPIHWGTFLRLGLHRTRPELLTEPPLRLARTLAERAPGVELQALAPGESLSSSAFKTTP